MNNADRRSIVRLLEPNNPKKQQPRQRYALYRDRMTIEEFISEVRRIGQPEQKGLDDLCWDQNQGYIRVEPPSSDQFWSVAAAKAKLSEILRLARAGEPQTIGTEEPCVVVSAEQYEKYFQPKHLGRFLIESAPRGDEFELPSRSDDRDPFADKRDPFAVEDNGRAA